jgi:hypothetical protein
MKRRLLLALAIVTLTNVGAITAKAQEVEPEVADRAGEALPVAPNPEATWSGTCSLDIWNKYLGGSSPGVIDNDPSLQPTCTLFHNPTGLYAGVWAALDVTDLGDLQNGGGHEVDYYIGWARELGDGWYVRLQAAYWDVPSIASGSAQNDSGEVLVRLKKDLSVFESLKPAVYGQIAWQADWSDPRAEFDAETGIELTIPLSDQWSISTFAEVIFDQGTSEAQSGFYWHTGGAVSWDVDKHVTFRPVQVRVMGPLSENWHGGKKTETVFGTGIDFKF